VALNAFPAEADPLSVHVAFAGWRIVMCAGIFTRLFAFQG
jgi:hypothetical protein